MSHPNSFDTLLLVEDNPGDVRLTKEMIKESELSPAVHVVSDGAEAVEFLHQRGEYRDAPRPDAVFLDLQLSTMDGTEVLDSMDDVSDISVVVLSGSKPEANPGFAEVEAKVDGYVEKPLEPETFEELVRSLAE